MQVVDAALLVYGAAQEALMQVEDDTEEMMDEEMELMEELHAQQEEIVRQVKLAKHEPRMGRGAAPLCLCAGGCTPRCQRLHLLYMHPGAPCRAQACLGRCTAHRGGRRLRTLTRTLTRTRTLTLPPPLTLALTPNPEP